MNIPALVSRPAVSAILYLGAVLALGAFALTTCLDLREGQQRREDLQQRLAALEGRRPAIAGGANGAQAFHPVLTHAGENDRDGGRAEARGHGLEKVAGRWTEFANRVAAENAGAD